jgi:hypothetical protein
MSEQYEQRYCAYIDILGFRHLVEQIRSGTIAFETIRDLLRRIQQPDNPYYQSIVQEDFHAQSISDAVVLSSRYSATGLAMLLDTIERLCLTVLTEGYFVRGGVCSGLLYHDDKTVFGDALIRAYRIESEIARYPRVMLTKDVIDSGQRTNLAHYFPEHTQRADDGPHYLHILSRVGTGLKHPDVPLGFDRSVIPIMRDRIQQRFDEAVDEPRHFEKVKWFALYWNESLFRFGEQYTVKGPGL